MDPNLYKAVKNGDVEYLDQHTDQFDNQVTPNQNTILHVAARFGKSECVARILKKKPCHLIRRVNLKGENPLHIAVTEQHYDVVQALINGAEELDRDPESGGGTRLQILRAANVDGDTPLHLAVREGDNSFVRLLADMDRYFQHSPNKARETPLYLAAERKNGDSLVESILVYESPAYTGPCDRTALHAAAISGNIGEIHMAEQNMYGGPGDRWDDKRHECVRKISVGHVKGTCIYSIQVVYGDKGDKGVCADKHGGDWTSLTKEDTIELNYPGEYITKVSGLYGRVIKDGEDVIRSLRFESNKRPFGPYGADDTDETDATVRPFSSPEGEWQILGFKGNSGKYLSAIGFHLSEVPKPSIWDGIRRPFQN